MKKKFTKILACFLLIFGLGLVLGNEKADASWGMNHTFTTSRATRGTWYWRQGRHIKRLRITSHTVNKHRLYQSLANKQYNYYLKKLYQLPDKQQLKTYKYFDQHVYEAYNFRFHGKNSFNINGWLAGAGDGIYYTPVQRHRYGKKVKAIRIGHGAGCWLTAYAYHSKKLAR